MCIFIGFQIIEKVKTDDLPSLEPGLIRKRRMDRELFWISALRTVAPLGLNDKIEGFGMRGSAFDNVGCGKMVFINTKTHTDTCLQRHTHIHTKKLD